MEVPSGSSPCLIDLIQSQALLWVFQGWTGKEDDLQYGACVHFCML